MNKHTQSSEESHMSAVESQPKAASSELIERLPIEGTPFVIVVTDQETFLTLGRYKIKYKDFTAQDYMDAVITHDWNLVIDIIGIASNYGK